ncbi:hypothetical protein HKD37_04G010489 [Glycine soja]
MLLRSFFGDRRSSILHSSLAASFRCSRLARFATTATTAVTVTRNFCACRFGESMLNEESIYNN